MGTLMDIWLGVFHAGHLVKSYGWEFLYMVLVKKTTQQPHQVGHSVTRMGDPEENISIIEITNISI